MTNSLFLLGATSHPLQSNHGIIDRIKMNSHLDDDDYFSVMSETKSLVHDSLKNIGYVIPNKSHCGNSVHVEISVGCAWVKFLQDSDFPVTDMIIKRRLYKKNTNVTLEVKVYHKALLGLFKKFIYTVWFPTKGLIYLHDIDPKSHSFANKLIAKNK